MTDFKILINLLFVCVLISLSEIGTGQEKTGSDLVVKKPADSTTIDRLSTPVKKEPIPFVPFKESDIKNTVFRNGKVFVQVVGKNGAPEEIPLESYLSEINRNEKHFNSLGHSLRDDGQNVTISVIIADKQKLETAKEGIDKNFLNVSKEFEDSLKKPEEVAKEYNRKINESTQAVIQKIYAKSGVKREDIPNFKLRKLDPDALIRRDDNLSTVTTKNWMATMGETEKFAAQAVANLGLSGSSSRLEASGDARVDVHVLGEELNVFYAGAKATTVLRKEKDEKKGTSANMKYMFFGVVIDEWEYGKSPKPSRDETLAKSVRYGKEYNFNVGPVACSAEIGVAGTVTIDYGAVVEENMLGYSVKPNANLRGYLEGAIDYEIVEAGKSAELTILREQLNVTAYIKQQVDPVSNDSVIVTGVFGENELTILSGYIIAYAEVINPLTLNKKRYQKELFSYPGLVTSRRKLFNFDKIVSRNGFRLRGAPKKEDVAEVNGEIDIGSAFKEGFALASDDVEESIRNRSNVETGVFREQTKQAHAWLEEFKQRVNRGQP